MMLGTTSVPHRSRVVAVAAALFACMGTAGCDDTTGDEAGEGSTGMEVREPVDDGVLELGLFAESRRFVAYQGGEEEVVEMGLQGGFHIFVDGRLRPDADLGEVVVELVVTRLDDGSEVTRIRHQRVPDIPDAEGWPTLPEMIIFIPDPASVYGEDVNVEVFVEALDGTLLDVLDVDLFLTADG
ncbi:MAG: hypothetical protein ACE37F_29010 [Nannocystaceae bacterium]|nr:hypothetical protein [bacterium]